MSAADEQMGVLRTDVAGNLREANHKLNRHYKSPFLEETRKQRLVGEAQGYAVVLDLIDASMEAKKKERAPA